jgi:hypothetical protein
MWWFRAGDPTSSFDDNDDSSMIVSYWCVSVGDTYHISNADSSSNSEPDEGDLEENLPFEILRVGVCELLMPTAAAPNHI